MANAASIIPVDLVPNGSLEAPTAQVLDTGTADVVLETPALGDLDRHFLEVTNAAAGDLVVTVSAGENPPAWRKALGALAAVTIAQNEVWLLGPFESARVGQADGKLQVTFSPDATINATFRCYRLPVV